PTTPGHVHTLRPVHEVIEIELEQSIGGKFDDAPKVVQVYGFTVSRQPLNFAFVPKLWESDPLRNCAKEDAKRVRIVYSVVTFDVVPTRHPGHRAYEISKTID